MPSDRADPSPSPADAATKGEAADEATSSKSSTGPASSKSAHPAHPEGNIKETIESILVAFILAFVFRAFVVEAFVIPTGSMAPTLLGAHMRYRCPDCGYRWDVNFSTGTSDDINIPPYAAWKVKGEAGREDYWVNVVYKPLHCPNCGFPVRQTDPDDPDNQLTSPPVHYGDRILVLKYLYLFQGPQRWDVVVFKSPADSSTTKLNEPQYAQNYIKRLVGRPGEVIVILDGDVYIGPGPVPDAARRPDGLIDTTAVDWSKFQIQHKPWYVQQVLWRNVYDNDYLPHLPRDPASPNAQTTEDKIPWAQPWTQRSGQAGWKEWDGDERQRRRTTRARVFHFDNPNGSAALDFDPAAIPDTYALTDHLAYDELDEQTRPWRKNPVGDLKLSLYYTRESGDGPLDLQLSKAGETFTARIERGRASLLKSHGTNPPDVLIQPTDVSELRSGGPVRLEFCNVDYQLQLRVDGRQVFSTNDEQYRPDVQGLVRHPDADRPAPGATIAAGSQRCRVEHVALSRDIYYLNTHTWPGQSRLWGDPEKPIELGADEFFVLGDNSFISGDARTWTSPAQAINLPDEALEVQEGRVPGRFMLGKAFFVYWPAGYRPSSRVPYGIIPNFGDMRFIH